MSTPRRLHLADCTDDEQVLARVEAWLQQYVDDAVRERASEWLADGADIDALDQHLREHRAAFQTSINAALANLRRELHNRQLARCVMWFVETHNLLPELNARLGGRRDAQAIRDELNRLLVEHIGALQQHDADST